MVYIAGWLFILIYLIAALPAIIKFMMTKNTLITIKPANSLQTNGIYSITRNPMYLGLLFLYTGIGLLTGNLWTLILIPVLVLIINNAVIKKEEGYLERAFGQSYIDYKKKARRWV
jgi:protein-S-isoprenylcysteine O-methyltransferase Ste14